MVVRENVFKFSQNFLSKAQLKKFSKATIIKLFASQSEVRALPKRCNLESMISVHSTTLLERVITVRTSCFDTDFASQFMKLAKLLLIDVFARCLDLP